MTTTPHPPSIAPPGSATPPMPEARGRLTTALLEAALLVVGLVRGIGESLARRWRLMRAAPEAGMATAEYAIATLAAAAFAGLLLVILGSDEVRGFLTDIIRRALQVG